jgi:hypothetical protein
MKKDSELRDRRLTGIFPEMTGAKMAEEQKSDQQRRMDHIVATMDVVRAAIAQVTSTSGLTRNISLEMFQRNQETWRDYMKGVERDIKRAFWASAEDFSDGEAVREHPLMLLNSQWRALKEALENALSGAQPAASQKSGAPGTPSP